MKRWIFASLFIALLGAALPAFGIGLIVVPEQEHWQPPIILPPRPIPPPWPQPPQPRPIPPPRPYPFAPLEINYARVNTRITDQIAVTSVEQEFFNPNPGRLEGTFLFPVPKGAQLDKFTMEIDGKPVEAELLPAEKARGIYEDIVRKMRDPALLEYAGHDVFKVRIFPIEPHSKKRVSLSYSQLLKADDGLVSYVLPLGTEKFSAKPIKSVSVKVELETRQPLKTVYSPSHKVEVKRDGAHRATAGYEASDVQPDADFALYFATEKDEIGLSLMTHRTRGEDGYFLLLAAPGVDVKEKNVVFKDVAFVLDTSGSMAGKKLEQAKKALQFCVENLNDGDQFEIIRFSAEVEPLFNKLVEASRENRSRAGDFIKDLKPIGGTAIDDALRKALALRNAERGMWNAEQDRQDRPFAVIFLTDGRPTIGTTDEDQIVGNVKKSAGQTRIFCFGIGTDVNTHLLDKIADESRAVSQYVLPEEDLEVKVSNFFAKIREPVLANTALTFTGDIRATKMYPSALPDLFRGDQLVLVGRYSGKGDSAVVIEGTVNGAAKKFTYEVKFVGESSDHEFIPRLWATRRVGYLLDEIRLHGENSELKDEVAELARKYGIVTPYTAYLIVEDEAWRNVPMAAQSLPQFREDRAARVLTEQAWRSYSRDVSGDAAVAGSRYGLAMKSAEASASALSLGRAEAQISLSVIAGATTAAGDTGVTERVTQYTQQQRFVSGRSFFQNGNQWIDAGVQKCPGAKPVRIQFGSLEYFELVRKQPQALPWLALGQNVQFVLENTLYEIYE